MANAKASTMTQSELAKLAGVSLKTVNRALSGHPEVQEETRKRIRELADRCGYKPNTAAQIMRAGRFNCLALLMSAVEGRSYLPGRLFDGIHDTAARHDLHVTVAKLPDEELADASLVPKALQQWMADGLLINYIHDIPGGLIDLIREHRVPSVWLNVKQPYDAVHPDDFGAGRLATEHLLHLGHRRIAYLDLSVTPHYSSPDRARGFSAAMSDAGLPGRVWAPEGPMLSGDRMAFLRDRLAATDRPTAIVAYQPEEAMQAHVAALQQGLRVPEDLSLVTFAESAESKTGIVLTTVLLPEAEIGVAGVEMLLRKIDEPAHAIPSVAVPMKLDYQQTTVPPSA